MIRKIKKFLKEARRVKRRIRQNTIGRMKHIIWALKEMNAWDYLVIHRRQLTKLPHSIAIPLWCRHIKGKLRCPKELTIILIHNYEKDPIMVRSLHYAGINDFIVLTPKVKGTWHNSVKIVTFLEYLKSGSCNTEYILFCDSDDAVIRDDPEKAIKYLHEENCDLLFSNTDFKGGYSCMPEVRQWADEIAQSNGYSNLYINTGVYIGKTSFVREVLEKAIEYVTDNDMPRKEYRARRRDGTLCEKLPDYPKGVGSDQVIMRFLHQQFYPRMKIDYANKLALR